MRRTRSGRVRWELLLTSIGLLLLVLSLFALDFTSLRPDRQLDAGGWGSSSFTLDEIGDRIEAGQDLGDALSRYVHVGRYVAVLMGFWALFTLPSLPWMVGRGWNIGAATLLLAGVMLIFHFEAMLVLDDLTTGKEHTVEGVTASPADGAWLGLVGYLGIIAGTLIRILGKQNWERQLERTG